MAPNARKSLNKELPPKPLPHTAAERVSLQYEALAVQRGGVPLPAGGRERRASLGEQLQQLPAGESRGRQELAATMLQALERRRLARREAEGRLLQRGRWQREGVAPRGAAVGLLAVALRAAAAGVGHRHVVPFDRVAIALRRRPRHEQPVPRAGRGEAERVQGEPRRGGGRVDVRQLAPRACRARCGR